MTDEPGTATIRKWVNGGTVSTDALIEQLEAWADYWRAECGRPRRCDTLENHEGRT